MTSSEEITLLKMTFNSLDYMNAHSFNTSDPLSTCISTWIHRDISSDAPMDLFFSVELIKITQHIWTVGSSAYGLLKESLSRES